MINSLSIIFPVFNEEARLKASFVHILSFLKKKKSFKVEIIFVDDGSQDRSYTLIKDFIKTLKKINKFKIRIIKSKKNLGKGSALKLGVKNARYNWILTTDIDMSVSLFQVWSWTKRKLINKKCSVYFGSRAHNKSNVDSKFYRKILGIIMRFVIFIILGIKIKDTQCGYKLYKKSFAKIAFSKLKNYGFDHDLEIILLLKSKNIKINELPVNWKHKSNSRLNIFIDPFKMFLGILLMRIRYF